MSASTKTEYDAIVVGGGPAGATAAQALACNGHAVLLLDKRGRIKPCGGAIPPRLVADFEIPSEIIVARAKSAQITAPSNVKVDMPIDGGGYVGMVDRGEFDEWLRQRACQHGANLVTGKFRRFTRDPDGTAVVEYQPVSDGETKACVCARARAVVGADGALSQVAKQAMPRSRAVPFVFAYHEILEAPDTFSNTSYDHERCEVIYDGDYSPDFYSWVFPHGKSLSIGTGTAYKGFSLRGSIASLRQVTGLDTCRTIRCEGAPIPLRPRKCWDNGRDVILAGDAAGTVAPASGEGIYYAMITGQFAAEAVDLMLQTGNVRHLASARKRFMKRHGRIFFILGLLQWFWYHSDWRREQFVKLCGDPDVQRLTWQSYMHKELVQGEHRSHMRVLKNDIAHLLGVAR